MYFSEICLITNSCSVVLHPGLYLTSTSATSLCIFIVLCNILMNVFPDILSNSFVVLALALILFSIDQYYHHFSSVAQYLLLFVNVVGYLVHYLPPYFTFLAYLQQLSDLGFFFHVLGLYLTFGCTPFPPPPPPSRQPFILTSVQDLLCYL